MKLKTVYLLLELRTVNDQKSLQPVRAFASKKLRDKYRSNNPNYGTYSNYEEQELILEVEE